jgi:NhaP-type Na+/H+ or K+/H+ antiporter
MGDDHFQVLATGISATKIDEARREEEVSANKETEPFPTPSIRSYEPYAMQVFFAWEKIRVFWNLLIFILLGLVLRCSPREFFLFLIAFNICFCTGPAIEGYLCWIGVPRLAARVVGVVLVTGVMVLVSGMKQDVPGRPKW